MSTVQRSHSTQRTITVLAVAIVISTFSLSSASTGNGKVTASLSWDNRPVVAFADAYKTGGTRTRRPDHARLTSRECLSCHDGSSARIHKDDVGFNDWSWQQPASFGSMGGHPVEVRYNTLNPRSRVRLFDPTTTPSGLGGNISEDLLIDSKVECSSCHLPHDASGRGSELRISNNGSSLCLTCHDI